MSSLTLQALRDCEDPELRLLVIGDPVDHSLSPPMHNAGLEFLHLPCRYGRLRVSPEDLGEAFRVLRRRDFIGWNLTLPHKLAARRSDGRTRSAGGAPWRGEHGSKSVRKTVWLQH